MKLNPRREGDAPPQSPFERALGLGGTAAAGRATALTVERLPNLLEGAPGFLHCLDAEELIEVLTAVMVAASDAKRRRQQLLLHVVPDRASRDTAEIGKVADGVTGFVRHARFI